MSALYPLYPRKQTLELASARKTVFKIAAVLTCRDRIKTPQELFFEQYDSFPSSPERDPLGTARLRLDYRIQAPSATSCLLSVKPESSWGFANRFCTTDEDRDGWAVSILATPFCCTSHSQRSAICNQYSRSFFPIACAASLLHSCASF